MLLGRPVLFQLKARQHHAGSSSNSLLAIGCVFGRRLLSIWHVPTKDGVHVITAPRRRTRPIQSSFTAVADSLAVKRIVSVCPSNTDLCAHLGILDRVVGRDNWSDWPDGQVEHIEVIGPVLNINVPRVAELKPDLILASLNVPGMERVVPRLRKTGLPLVIYDPETWDDVLGNIIDLGDRLGLEERAASVVKNAREAVSALQDETAHLPWIDLCVEWWPNPVIVPMGQTYVNHVLSWVKVRNSFQNIVHRRSGKVSISEGADANPDLYAVSWCGTSWDNYDETSVLERYGGSGARFIEQEGRIFKLWEGEIGHPSLRLLDGARRILDRRLTLNI